MCWENNIIHSTTSTIRRHAQHYILSASSLAGAYFFLLCLIFIKNSDKSECLMKNSTSTEVVITDAKVSC